MIPAVHAHGLVGRADLPLPAELFGAAAAIVLALSFAALAAGWTRPRLQEPRRLPLERVPAAVEAALGALGVLAFAAVVYAGLAGTGIPTENLAPTAVYVIFWVGIPVVSILLGDVFRLVSPWRAVARAGGGLVKRLGGDGLGDPLPYPERLGRLPAAAGLFVFAAVELCWRDGNDPATLAVLALAYFAMQIVGMSVYGVEPWSRNGDAFGVYFRFFGSLSPLARPPLSGASAVDARPRGTVALLAVGIGSTTFDGAKEGPLFGDLAPRLQDAFGAAGLSKGASLELSFLIGLVLAIGLVALIYRLGVAGMRRSGGIAGGGGRPAVRALADPDRRGVRGGALLLAARLPGAGGLVTALGPARRRQRPARHRGRDDRLRRDLGDRHLVRAGGGARDRARHGAGARVRPRPGALARPRRRDALPVRHAGGDDRLHRDRAVAALGGERVSVPAHAGHWAVQLLYALPVLFVVAAIVWSKIAERREAREDAIADLDDRD